MIESYELYVFEQVCDNKYKQHTPPRSPKRIEWKLLRVIIILNTNTMRRAA